MEKQSNLWIGRLNIVKTEILPKLIYILNTIPIKILSGFFGRNWHTDPKIYMAMKNTVKRIFLGKKNRIKLEDLYYLIWKFTIKSHESIQCGIGVRTDI